MKIIIDKNALNDIQTHATTDYPYECCGFLYGSDEQIRTVTQIRRAANSKQSDKQKRFRIDPDEYREAEQYARTQDLNLLGVYHSHPDHPAEPSGHDRKVALPYFSYIIISVQKGEPGDVRSWQLNEESSFVEEPLKIQRITTQHTT